MAQQRLDKLLAGTGRWSRREAKDLIRQGRVAVDGLRAGRPEDGPWILPFPRRRMRS